MKSLCVFVLLIITSVIFFNNKLDGVRVIGYEEMSNVYGGTKDCGDASCTGWVCYYSYDARQIAHKGISTGATGRECNTGTAKCCKEDSEKVICLRKYYNCNSICTTCSNTEERKISVGCESTI